MSPQDFGANCPQFEVQYLLDSNDLPLTLVRGLIYIVGPKGEEWLAALSCPCGCEAEILLNLLQDEHPYWTWHIEENSLITLTPAIYRSTGCHSHFFIVKSQVHWCDSPVTIKNH